MNKRSAIKKLQSQQLITAWGRGCSCRSPQSSSSYSSVVIVWMPGHQKSQTNDQARCRWASAAWQSLTVFLLMLIYPINCCSWPFYTPTWGQLEMCGREPLPLINLSPEFKRQRGRESHEKLLPYPDKLYCPTPLLHRDVSLLYRLPINKLLVWPKWWYCFSCTPWTWMIMINSGGLESVRVIKSVKVSSSDDSHAK